jgi:hypothetical protein
MSQPTRTADFADFWRTLPILLAALLAAVVSVDMLLTFQPTWLDELSRALQRVIAMQPMAAPMASVLAASVAVVSIVLASALLLVFSRTALLAPHATLAPAWVALWTLAVVRIPAPLPLPMALQAFIALSALLFVGASAALSSGSRVSALVGYLLLISPFGIIAVSLANAPRASSIVDPDSMWVLGGLLMAAVGVALLALIRTPAKPAGVEGLEGLDVVEELFAQVERAERSEARCAELERELRAYHQPATLQRSSARGAR